MLSTPLIRSNEEKLILLIAINGPSFPSGDIALLSIYVLSAENNNSANIPEKQLSLSTMVNIDHHDDIFSGNFGHPESEIDALNKFDRVMEGNWGMWLQTKGRLKSFTWIGNADSHNLVHVPFAEKYINNFRFCTREQYDFASDCKFDQIFVCQSPGYVPPLHWHMIGTFMTVYEEMTGNKVDLNKFNRKYEMEKYYAQVTEYITKGKNAITK